LFTFGSNFSEQLPLIGAGLEIGDGFSTVAFDRRLVVSPDFPEQEKGRRENKEKEIGVGTLWWMEEKIETTLFFYCASIGGIQAEEPCSLYFVVE
jgi:hypothetical protein